MIEPKIGVVIVAGGSGKRLGGGGGRGGGLPKQFQFLGSRPMLAHTIESFSRALPKAEIVVVLAADRCDYWRNLSSRFEIPKHRVVAGGEERYHSVKAGIEALSEDVEIIGVHDGARPLCSEELIRRCLSCALSSGSAIPVVAVSDSLREVVGDGELSRAVDRSTMRAVQTPQMFDAALIRRAYSQPYTTNITDDASLVEQMGERVWLCEGDSANIKITTQSDMNYARQIFESDNE